MAEKATDVRGGFNSYVDTLCKDGHTYTLTAIPFDSAVRDPIFENVPLDGTVRLTTSNYVPGGNTALYDAISVIISRMLERTDVDKNHDRFTVIIMTDGEENSSRYTSKEQVARRIKELQDKGNWTFVYMGADQDAWSIASNIGIYQGNALQFNSKQMRGTFDRLATATSTASGTSSLSSTSYFTGGDDGSSISSRS